MEDTSFTTAIIRVADRARTALGPHPDPGELAAYAEGGLDAAAQERLRDHFALCHDCVQCYLALRQLLDELPTLEVHLSPEQLAADWAALRHRLITAGLLNSSPAGPDE